MRTVASSSHYEVHGPLPNIQTGTHQPTHCRLLIDAIVSSFDKRWRKIHGPLLESKPTWLAPWHSFSTRVLETGNDISPFEAANGKDPWSYFETNPGHSQLFNDAMACDTRLTVPAIIKGCLEVFDGVESLVDVGGGTETALSLLVKAFPRIRGINFDLPHVVAVPPKSGSIENVGGDMFMSIPNADAAFIMFSTFFPFIIWSYMINPYSIHCKLQWVLHDWDDEECIKILKKCREAIPEDKGKVIIVEAVLEEDKEGNELGFVGLMLDMAMMAHTDKGKERTLKEWSYSSTIWFYTIQR
ncbi:hypothetical protein J1N35_042205 [Gossypium stocksii]|uniref:O-methyltransferase C-terminal domain-containing protein n=1 Tax=Gossypium stocksii TaxID=47602 RepID=A0A9D3UH48_9ROSI|nr:hypothetical protein J1N35_042205 [Gossypium stocksii]